MPYLGAKPDAFQYTSTSSQSLSGDGVTTTFTLSRQVSANSDIEVVVNNVPQEPGFAYYVTNLTNLIFTAAPSAAANNIYIIYRQFVQSGIAPGANTVTTSAIAANTIQPWQLTSSLLNPVVNTFTGTGANTVYTLAFTPPSSNSVVVTINGITQNPPVNYSTNGSTLTFTDPPALNSVIRVMQQAVIGTSIVPVDGSVGTSKLAEGSVTTSKLADGLVTTSKLASGLTLSGSTTLSGNLTFTGTGTRILGDFSNSTVANRTAFQSITANGFTTLTAIPNGTSTSAGFTAVNNSDPTNSSTLTLNSLNTEARILASAIGSATFLPITFYTGGSERLRLDANGNFGIATTSPLGKVDVSWGGRTAGQIPAILVGANSDSTTRSDATQKMGVIGAAHYTNAQSPVGLISSNSYASNNDVYVGGGFAGSTAATSVSFWTAANSTTTQGTERMRIDSSGNIGIGAAASAWSGYKGVEIVHGGSTGALAKWGSGLNTAIVTNAFFGSNWTYYSTNTVALYQQETNATHNFYSAPSGTAGTTVSFTNLLNFSRNNTVALQGASSVAGTGITFPATQSASSDANTLDDYEEGTWTPTISMQSGTSTGSSGEGTYVKIGRQVTVTVLLSVGTISAGAVINGLAGLPFSARSGNDQAVGLLRENSLTGFGWELRINSNSNAGLIRKVSDNADAIQTGMAFLGTATYFI
jgi:hypothetical protein